MLDRGLDQAAGLRRLVQPAPVRLWPLAVLPATAARWIPWLAAGLNELGRRPVVVDAARGQVAAGFGMLPRGDLLELLEGRADFDRVAQRSREGIHVLRGDHGIEAFAGSGEPADRLLAAFGSLSHGFTDLLLAMPGPEIACVAAPAAHVPVLTVDVSGRGVMGSYALIKQLAGEFSYRRFACIVTGAASEDEARAGLVRVQGAAQQFLRAQACWAGWMPPAGDERSAAEAGRAVQALLQLDTPAALAA